MGPLSFVCLPEFGKISNSKESQIHLMAKFVAGKNDEDSRNPIALSAVLDVSGSMAGTKIETLKTTMQKLVKNLSSNDYLGIVVFQSQIREVLPPIKMDAENKKKAAEAIAAITPSGGTNMSGGILRGFEQFSKMDLPILRIKPKNRVEALEVGEPTQVEYVKRMIVLTDGEANEGLLANDINGFMKLVEQAPEKVTISTFGYGAGHDEKLLSSISDKGKGGFYYIENEEQMSPTFARELGGLMCCIGQNLQIDLETNADVKIIEVVSDNFEHKLSSDGKTLHMEIPDIYAEESMRTLVKLSVPKPSKAISARDFKIVTVKGKATNMKTMKVNEFDEKVKIKFVDDPEVDKKSDKEVAECIVLLVTAKSSREALKMAEHGNFVGARGMMVNAQQAFLCNVASLDSDAQVRYGAMSQDLAGMVDNYASPENFANNSKSLRSYTSSVTTQRSTGVKTDSYFNNASIKKAVDSFDKGSKKDKKDTK